MPTLYLRNVPVELHDELRRRAEEEHTSISAEAIRMLKRGLRFTPAGVEAFIAEVEANRPRARKGGPSIAELIRADRESH